MVAQVLRDPQGPRHIAEFLRSLSPDEAVCFLTWMDEEHPRGADAVLRADPDAPHTLLVRGQRALEEGDLESAVDLFLDALPLFDDETATPFLRAIGISAVAHEEWELAENALCQLLEREPHDPEAVQSLALTLELQGRHEEVTQLLAEACEAHPEHARLRLLHGVQLVDTAPDEAEGELETSYRLQEDAGTARVLSTIIASQGHFDRAAEWALKARDLDPGDEETNILAAVCLQEAGRGGEALAIMDDEAGAWPALVRVALQKNQGNVAEAKSVLRDPVLHDWTPSSRYQEEYLAQILLCIGLEAEALSLLDVWLDRPGFGDATRKRLLWIRTRLRARSGPHAPMEIPEELSEDVEEDRLILYEATLLVEAGCYGEALDRLEKAPPMEVENVELMLEDLAQMFSRQDEHDLKERAYRILLEREPDNTLALNNLALTLKKKGDLDQARELFERAVEVDPWAVPERLNLAETLRQLGEVEKAVEVCEQGLGADYTGHEHYQENLSLLREEAARLRREEGGGEARPMVPT